MSKYCLEKVVQILGGQVALAEAVGVKQSYVWAWLNKTIDGVPEKKVIEVAKAVNWQVTPHELRPDIYPHPHDGLPEHLRSAA